MKGITFGNLHSWRDLDLILQPGKEIASPTVKVKKIDIEGADSALDYTDYFGEPKYEDMRHKFDFQTIVPQSQFLAQYSRVKNALHGKKTRVILDDDPLFYYMGRVHVSNLIVDKAVGKLSIEVECEPYKYKLEKTVVTQAVNGSVDVNLPNLRKRVVPEVSIETAGAIQVVFRVGNVWDLGSGSYTLPELELTEGDNIVTLTGIGTVVFSYQEAGL